MQRGYCSVATRYSPGLVRQQAFSSPEATLKVVCRSSSLLIWASCCATYQHLKTSVLFLTDVHSEDGLLVFSQAPSFRGWAARLCMRLLYGRRWWRELWRCQGG